MNSAGKVLNETRRQHQPGEVANFTISLPQNVDVCTLYVRIRAGNSAGMSVPSEAVKVGKLQLVTINTKLQESQNHYFLCTKNVQKTAQTLLLLPLLPLFLLLLVLKVGVRITVSEESVPH